MARYLSLGIAAALFVTVAAVAACSRAGGLYI